MILELSRTFRVDGFDLQWDRWGSGDRPLVLAHGFSGSGHDFALQVEALAHRRPVIVIDHRGHGASTKSGDPDDYTVDAITRDLVSFLESEVDGPVDLLGHSMGGRVAMHVALERPELLRSAMFMDTTAWEFGPADGDEVRAVIVSFLETVGPETEIPDLDSPEDPLVDQHTPLEWRARREQLSDDFDWAALRSLGLALFRDELTPIGDRLGEIDVPVTVMAGSYDRPFIDHAPRLAAEVVNGRLEIFDGAYHSPQLTHAAQWRAAVEAHLAWASS